MEKSLKSYIAEQLIGQKLHFRCDCIISMDVEGVVKDFDVVNNEIIFIIDINGKLIKIGENHPKMKIIL